MTRHCVSLSLGAVTLAVAIGAQAQGVDELGTYGGQADARAESRQDMAIELRFGRYIPNIDSEFSDSGIAPYATAFGSGLRYIGGIEVDWQLLRIPKFGSFGPGVGWGYTRSSARARLSGRSELSGQDTSLWIMPTYVVGVLRVDVLARETFVPLVPYGKLGLCYALWSASDGGNTAMAADGTRGKGSSYGPQFALGLMLLLDVLEPSSAQSMDNAAGINSSYLFAEWYLSNLDNFGSGDALRVGSNTWTAGIAIEF